MKKIKFWLSVFTIVGTIIGAGILGLPYAISKTGFIPGLILTLIIAYSMTILLLYLENIVVKCKEVLQLPGLARKYLGKKSYIATFIMFILSIYGALISYNIGISEAFVNLIGAEKWIYSLLLTIGIGILIYEGIRLIDKIQFVIVSILLVSLIAITIFIAPKINIENLLQTNWAMFFYPFGVIFFALTGYSVIPEIEDIISKRLFKKAVIVAMLISTSIYIWFFGSFIGAYKTPKQVATESLEGNLRVIGLEISIFGMITSYLGLGIALRDVYKNDLGQGKLISTLLTVGVPFLISVLFNPSFIEPIMITGAYTGTIIGFIIMGIWLKINKKITLKEKINFGIVFFVLMAGLITTTIFLIQNKI